jgi:ParB family chromosome partitioning protein
MNKIRPPSNLVRGVSSDQLLIDELASSIRQNGLLQPIIVRMQDNSFEIVAGNRRYNACKRLGWRKILCHVVELEDREAFEFALTENIQRRTLDPLEEAKAFKVYVQDFGWGGVSALAAKNFQKPWLCMQAPFSSEPTCRNS